MGIFGFTVTRRKPATHRSGKALRMSESAERGAALQVAMVAGEIEGNTQMEDVRLLRVLDTGRVLVLLDERTSCPC